MKNVGTILTQLTDTDTVLDSLYEAVAGADPRYPEEMRDYTNALQTLVQEVPGAQECLDAMRQELASDIRFAMWQGFVWNLDCFRNPVNKLLANLDFEELCQESRMHTLPVAQAAQQRIRAFLQTIPEDKQDLLDPIIDHFAYLKTYAYKLAHHAGFTMADNLLPLVIPGYINDSGLTMQYLQLAKMN